MPKVTIELDEQDGRFLAAALLTSIGFAESHVMLTLIPFLGEEKLYQGMRALMVYAAGGQKPSDIDLKKLESIRTNFDRFKILAATIFKQTNPELADYADEKIEALLRPR